MNLLYIIKVSSYTAFPNRRGSFFASLVGKGLGKRGLLHLRLSEISSTDQSHFNQDFYFAIDYYNSVF